MLSTIDVVTPHVVTLMVGKISHIHCGQEINSEDHFTRVLDFVFIDLSIKVNIRWEQTRL